MKLLSFFLIAMIFFAGIHCKDNTGFKECICTTVFAYSTVTILNRDKQPVAPFEIEIKRAKTGEVINIEQNSFLPKGVYVVLDDMITQKLTTKPEVFYFKAVQGSMMINIEYQFNTDDCNCHINKVAGPDTFYVN